MDKTEIFMMLVTEANRASGRRQSNHQQIQPKNQQKIGRLGATDSFRATRCDGFVTRTAGLQTRITKMRTFLAKNGKDYLNIYNIIQNSASQISDQVDFVIESFIKNYNQATDRWRDEIESNRSTFPKQVVNHRLAVIEMLKRDLNEFGKLYSRLNMIRAKRLLDKQQMDRLEKPGTLIDFDPSQINKSLTSTSASTLLAETAKGRHEDSHSSILEKINNSTGHQSSPTSIKTKRRNIIVADDNVEKTDRTSRSSEKNYQKEEFVPRLIRDSFASHMEASNDDDEQSCLSVLNNTTLTQQELQMLAAENSVIHDEMLSVEDEIRTIGSKVVQIAKLQQTFAEKVMEQDLQLERLHETTVRSSENVREGNELIRDAMKNNASLRAFFLFYILLLGFTILFLDWYNP